MSDALYNICLNLVSDAIWAVGGIFGAFLLVNKKNPFLNKSYSFSHFW